MKPYHYEVALPLIGRFLYYDSDIYHVLISDVINLLNRANTIRELRLSYINDYFSPPELEEGRVIPLITRLTIKACAPTLFLHYLWKSCSYLQELTLLDCAFIVDADISYIQLNCEHLSKLTVKKSFGLSRPKLLDLFNDGNDHPKAKLHHLELSHCPNIHKLTFNTSQPTFTSYLKFLNVSLSRINNEALLDIFHSCSQLEEVKAEMCMGLTDELTIQSKALKSLNLSHCIKIETLILDSPALVVLKLDFCESLQSIGFSSPLENMRQLDFVLLKNLRTIDWNYGTIPSTSNPSIHPRLNRLNICGCLRFGEIADINEDREEAELKIKENMFNYPFYSKYIGKEERSRIETELIPLINWLVETIYCCPSLNWNVFFNDCIGGTLILAHLNMLKPMIYRIVDLSKSKTF
eukprot:gene8947-9686_t